MVGPKFSAMKGGGAAEKCRHFSRQESVEAAFLGASDRCCTWGKALSQGPF